MSNVVTLAPAHLTAYIAQHHVNADFLAPGVPMPTVPSAAAAIGVPVERILKTLVFADGNGAHVVAVANGVARVDRALLAAACELQRLRVASPETVLTVTGYPAGGVSPLGLPSGTRVVVDSAVLLLPEAFGGGGHEELLLRVIPADIVRLNQAVVATIVQQG